jgi:hypothetical protein
LCAWGAAAVSPAPPGLRTSNSECSLRARRILARAFRVPRVQGPVARGALEPAALFCCPCAGDVTTSPDQARRGPVTRQTQQPCTGAILAPEISRPVSSGETSLCLRQEGDEATHIAATIAAPSPAPRTAVWNCLRPCAHLAVRCASGRPLSRRTLCRTPSGPDCALWTVVPSRSPSHSGAVLRQTIHGCSREPTCVGGGCVFQEPTKNSLVRSI